MKRSYLPFLFLVIVLLAAIPLQAMASIAAPSMQQLTDDADRIVVGRVIDVDASWNADNTCIDTRARVVVERTIKGSPSGVLTIFVPGGRVGADEVIVSDMPGFKIGERVLLFLRAKGDGSFEPVGGKWGKKAILGNVVIESKMPLTLVIEEIQRYLLGPAYTGSSSFLLDAAIRAGERQAGVATPVQREMASEEPQLDGGMSYQVIGPDTTGTVVLMDESFEGPFPPVQYAAPHDSSGTATTFWGPTDYKAAPGSSKSLWCAGNWRNSEGTIIDPWNFYYPTFMGYDPETDSYIDSRAWIVFGPFDLTGASTAKLTFKLWLDSAKPADDYVGDPAKAADYIYWGASADGAKFDLLKISGKSDEWQLVAHDLTPFCGDDQVWIAFRFTSDGIESKLDGAFIDDVKVEKSITAPHIASVSPSTASAGTGARVTITGDNFGERTDVSGVVFYCGDIDQSPTARILSWSDTKIEVEVPQGASSGEVYVVADGAGEGAISNPSPFTVTFSYAGSRWSGADASFGYHINESDTPEIAGDQAAIQAAIEKAFKTWNDIPDSKINAVYNGPTGKSGLNLMDGINAISFSQTLTDTVSRTTTRISNGYIVEQDTELNANLAWSTSLMGSPDAYDLQAVMTHEVGHWLGFGNLYGSGDADKTMYESIEAGEIRRRTLEPDDKAGASLIYPEDNSPVGPNDLKATSGIERVTLTWNAGSDPSIVGYDIYRRVGPDGPYERVNALGPVVETTYTAEGLDPTPMHYYKVRAVNSLGADGSWSNEVSVQPLKDTEPPDIPEELTATVQGDTIALTWIASTSADIAGYNIYRDTTETGATMVKLNPELLPGAAVGFEDPGVERGTTYFYWITALDNAYMPNESDRSESASAMVPLPDDGTGDDSGDTDGDPDDGNSGGDTDGDTDTGDSGGDADGANDKDDTDGTNTGSPDTGSSSGSGGGSGGGGSGGGGSSPAAVTAPANLKAAATATQIMLSWDKVDGAVGYNLYRKAGSGTYGKVNAAVITGATYADSTAKPGITYFYCVVGLGSDGKESERSNEVPAALTAVMAEQVFSDVSAQSWYRDAITRLIPLEVIGGYPDGTFRPMATVTRAEFAKMICLAMGWELENPSQGTFSDVPKDDWAYRYVETVKKHGAIAGYPNGTFMPANNITRAEVAFIISKALKLPAGGGTLRDAEANWAREHISSCLSAGVISGYTDGTFKPDNTASRAEAAKIIAQMLDKQRK